MLPVYQVLVPQGTGIYIPLIASPIAIITMDPHVNGDWSQKSTGTPVENAMQDFGWNLLHVFATGTRSMHSTKYTKFERQGHIIQFERFTKYYQYISLAQFSPIFYLILRKDDMP